MLASLCGILLFLIGAIVGIYIERNKKPEVEKIPIDDDFIKRQKAIGKQIDLLLRYNGSMVSGDE